MECGLCDGMRICGCGRDWHEERRAQFSAMAMQAMIEKYPSELKIRTLVETGGDLGATLAYVESSIAGMAVQYADALIKALQEPAAEKI